MLIIETNVFGHVQIISKVKKGIFKMPINTS